MIENELRPIVRAVLATYKTDISSDGVLARIEEDIVREAGQRLPTPAALAVVNTVAHWQPSVEPEQAATSALDRAIYAARAALVPNEVDAVAREASWRRGFVHRAHVCHAESTGRFCRDCGKVFAGRCEVCGIKTKPPMVRCAQHLQRSEPWTD